MNSSEKHCEILSSKAVVMTKITRMLVVAGLSLAFWMADTAIIGVINPDSSLGVANAQEAQSQKRKNVRTPAMREKVYKRLAIAQEAAENKEYDKAMDVLNEVKADPGMNCYEVAMTWNFIAYVYTVQGDYVRALPAYNNILKQGECVPEALEQQTLYAISQMYLATDKPRDAIITLKKWFKIATPNPKAYVFLGQCYFLIDDFRSAVIEVEKALALNKTYGAEPRENWLLILRAAYYELNNNPKVIEALEELARLYPKGEYFLQLSGMYGDAGNETKQGLVLEASYDGGYFKKESEYVSLSSLLLNEDVPYKAAKVMEEGIKKKLVKGKINNLKILAQAWLMAQEPKNSIRVLKQAAKISDDGELYIRLGQSYMNLDEWTACVAALKNGIKKGGIKREDSAQISMGICLYNTDNLDAAIGAFKKAAKYDRSVKFAKSWIDFLRNEKARRQSIEASLI